MKFLFSIFFLFLLSTMENESDSSFIVFAFDNRSDVSNRKVVDEVVMGGPLKRGFLSQ